MAAPYIKTPQFPSGVEDFAKIREWRVNPNKTPLTIADKTGFLPDLLNSANEVTVFTRPIRFMKSSILSMIERFIAIQDADSNRALFDGLAISEASYADFREQHQGQAPVIFLTLKNIKAVTWPLAKASFSKIIAILYEKHCYALNSLTKREQEQYQRIMSNQGEPGELEESLSDLATYLYKHYNKKVIILIDEYDTPMHTAHRHTKQGDRKQDSSYFQLMSDFMGTFLGGALKGHPHVEKGFMTGVLRTAFASLVSSLNNATIYSVLSHEFAGLFGFTEVEIESFINQIEGIEQHELDKLMGRLQRWYNGYYIGNSGIKIYNPWSVAKFFNNLTTSGDLNAQPYWLQTGDSLALSEYLTPRFKRLESQLTELISGREIEVEIDERTNLSNLNNPYNDSAFWGLLLHSGYLSARSVYRNMNTLAICQVCIPNYEVAGAYAHLISCYQQDHLLAASDPSLENYKAMLMALRSGNIDKFAVSMQTYMEQAVSFHDIPNKAGHSSGSEIKQEPEKIREQVYHAFMLGLLAGLHSSYFQLSSNREAGYGRYDIVLMPSEDNQHGLIFEFKATDNPDKLLAEANNAVKQIEQKRYAAILEARGVASGIHIGISFCGKRFQIAHQKVEYSLQPGQEFQPLESPYSESNIS